MILDYHAKLCFVYMNINYIKVHVDDGARYVGHGFLWEIDENGELSIGCSSSVILGVFNGAARSPAVIAGLQFAADRPNLL